MTYSIIGRDEETGALGVAIQSAVVSVGSQCIWAEAGVGAVATQSLLRTSHGPSGLTLMRNGHNAREALAAVLAGDNWKEARQVAMMDTDGKFDGFTGATCVHYSGHSMGEHCTAQANMMANEGVPEVMVEAFEESREPFVLRLVDALRAAQSVGGDLRGQQSAALKIVSTTLFKNIWEGVLYDVRVDNHKTPVEELASICTHQLSGHIIGEGFELAYKGDFDGAMAKYRESLALDPDEAQPRFLFAMEVGTMLKRPDLVDDILREFFTDSRWREYFKRMADVRLGHDPAARAAVEALLPG